MTNLEYYKDEIKQIMKRKNEETMILNEVVGNAFNDFSLKYVNNYPYDHFKFIDWLLEEQKEKIKFFSRLSRFFSKIMFDNIDLNPISLYNGKKPERNL